MTQYSVVMHYSSIIIYTHMFILYFFYTFNIQARYCSASHTDSLDTVIQIGKQNSDHIRTILTLQS